jgi:hypothetical protein
MFPDNSRISGVTGYCLVTSDKKHFVFFVEDTNSVAIDLNGMSGNQPVISVDTKMDYCEIERGTLTADIHTINLGRTSDWALAVGEFREKSSSEQSME